MLPPPQLAPKKVVEKVPQVWLWGRGGDSAGTFGLTLGGEGTAERKSFTTQLFFLIPRGCFLPKGHLLHREMAVLALSLPPALTPARAQFQSPLLAPAALVRVLQQVLGALLVWAVEEAQDVTYVMEEPGSGALEERIKPGRDGLMRLCAGELYSFNWAAPGISSPATSIFDFLHY